MRFQLNCEAVFAVSLLQVDQLWFEVCFLVDTTCFFFDSVWEVRCVLLFSVGEDCCDDL